MSAGAPVVCAGRTPSRGQMGNRARSDISYRKPARCAATVDTETSCERRRGRQDRVVATWRRVESQGSRVGREPECAGRALFRAHRVATSSADGSHDSGGLKTRTALCTLHSALCICPHSGLTSHPPPAPPTRLRGRGRSAWSFRGSASRRSCAPGCPRTP